MTARRIPRTLLRIVLAVPLIAALTIGLATTAGAAPAVPAAVTAPTAGAYDCWNQPWYPWVQNGEVATHVEIGCDVQMAKIRMQVDIEALDPSAGGTQIGFSTTFTFPDTATASADASWDPGFPDCRTYTHYATQVRWTITAYDGTTWSGKRQLDWVPLDVC